jgi:hypothetical protein
MSIFESPVSSENLPDRRVSLKCRLCMDFMPTSDWAAAARNRNFQITPRGRV